MKILTVRNPYAWAIIHGGKTVENRSRDFTGGYRGPVAIHVSKTDADGPDIDDPTYGLVYGACPHQRDITHNSWTCNWCTSIALQRHANHGHIIGVAYLWEVHHASDWRLCFDSSGDVEQAVLSDVCSPWAMPDQYHLQFEAPIALATPIPYRGALGMRPLPPDIVEAIRQQVRGPVCPDCRDGKHHNCEHQAWDLERDMPVPCACGATHDTRTPDAAASTTARHAHQGHQPPTRSTHKA